MQKPRLYIDFYKTLSFDLFWQSLPAQMCDQVQEYLFRNNHPIAKEWMCGRVSAEDVCQHLSEELGLDQEMLFESLKHDSERMSFVDGAEELLTELRGKYKLILATDNMDTLLRFTVPTLHLDTLFDLILTGPTVGYMKCDRAGSFFTDHVDLKYQIRKDDILIDDREEACELFESFSGTAYRVTKDQTLVDHLQNIISSNE